MEDMNFTKRTNDKIYTEYGSDEDQNDESLLGTDTRQAPNQILNNDRQDYSEERKVVHE